MEDHVQQHEDDKENDRENNLEPLLSPQFKFIFAYPLVGVTRRKVQFLLEHVIRGVHEVAVISGTEIDVDVSGQRSVLITDHGGPA